MRERSGRNVLDNTFGPEVVFQKAPVGANPDRSPKAGMQFFGEVEIEGRSQWMTVRLRDMAGAVLFSRTLSPER